MRKQILIIALGLFFALTVATQLAAQESGQKYKDRYTKDLFNEADTNQDGYVSMEEVKSVSKDFEQNRMGRKRFNAADIDNDGRLSPNEAQKYKSFEVRNRDELLKRSKKRKAGAARDAEGTGTVRERTKKENATLKRPIHKVNVRDKKVNTRKRSANRRGTETER